MKDAVYYAKYNQQVHNQVRIVQCNQQTQHHHLRLDGVAIYTA